MEEVMNLLLIPIFIILGWVVGIAVNHITNVLPLKESFWQRPFCKRRLNYQGSEFISTAEKGQEDETEPEYCHALKPTVAWSGLVAYLTGNQTCTVCSQAMGPRAPIVEIVLPILFVFLALNYPLNAYLGMLCVYTTILMILMVTDLEHRLIQHRVIIPAILIAFAGSLVTPQFSWKQALVGGITCFIAFYIFAVLSRGNLGGGDVTLATFLGIVTAFPTAIMVVIYSITLGGIVAFGLIIIRRATLKTFIPYGPFLIVVGWLAMVWGDRYAPWA